MLLNYGVGKDSGDSFGLQGDPTSPSWRRSVLGVHWKDWCWNWISNTLATWCEELTRWERMKAGGEGDDRGWDGWMASPTWWTWVWVSCGSWWWTGSLVCCSSWGSQRFAQDWATEPHWRSFYRIEMLAKRVRGKWFYRVRDKNHFLKANVWGMLSKLCLDLFFYFYSILETSITWYLT